MEGEEEDERTRLKLWLGCFALGGCERGCMRTVKSPSSPQTGDEPHEPMVLRGVEELDILLGPKMILDELLHRSSW